MFGWWWGLFLSLFGVDWVNVGGVWLGMSMEEMLVSGWFDDFDGECYDVLLDVRLDVWLEFVIVWVEVVVWLVNVVIVV